MNDEFKQFADRYEKETGRKVITVAPMCDTHQSLLVHQLHFSETDPWRALVIVTQVALFQAASADESVWNEIGDVEKIPVLGCLACRKPDVFGKIIGVAEGKSRDTIFRAIKDLGESYITPKPAS